jgi:hypothetical protein
VSLPIMLERVAVHMIQLAGAPAKVGLALSGRQAGQLVRLVFVAGADGAAWIASELLGCAQWAQTAPAADIRVTGAEALARFDARMEELRVQELEAASEPKGGGAMTST